MSASIYERAGPYGRYYIAEIFNAMTTAEGDRMAVRRFYPDELLQLAHLARRTYTAAKQLEEGPAVDPITPDMLN